MFTFFPVLLLFAGSGRDGDLFAVSLDEDAGDDDREDFIDLGVTVDGVTDDDGGVFLFDALLVLLLPLAAATAAGTGVRCDCEAGIVDADDEDDGDDGVGWNFFSASFLMSCVKWCSGSQLLCLVDQPSHFTRYSLFPFTVRASSTFSTDHRVEDAFRDGGIGNEWARSVGAGERRGGEDAA